jgi:hypothetical protein
LPLCVSLFCPLCHCHHSHHSLSCWWHLLLMSVMPMLVFRLQWLASWATPAWHHCRWGSEWYAVFYHYVASIRLLLFKLQLKINWSIHTILGTVFGSGFPTVTILSIVFGSVFPKFTILFIVLSCVLNLSPQNLSFLSCCLVCTELSQLLKPKAERVGLVTQMRLYTSKQQKAFNSIWDQCPCNLAAESSIGITLQGCESLAHVMTTHADWLAFTPLSLDVPHYKRESQEAIRIWNDRLKRKLHESHYNQHCYHNIKLSNKWISGMSSQSETGLWVSMQYNKQQSVATLIYCGVHELILDN